MHAEMAARRAKDVAVMRFALFAIVVVATTFPEMTKAVEPEPVFLACKPAKGSNRIFAAVILFKHLHKLRVVYGDGGMIDWYDVDYSRGLIATNAQGNGGTVTLTADYSSLVYRDVLTNEVTHGTCRVSRASPRQRPWLNPTMPQY